MQYCCVKVVWCVTSLHRYRRTAAAVLDVLHADRGMDRTTARQRCAYHRARRTQSCHLHPKIGTVRIHIYLVNNLSVHPHDSEKPICLRRSSACFSVSSSLPCPRRVHILEVLYFLPIVSPTLLSLRRLLRSYRHRPWTAQHRSHRLVLPFRAPLSLGPMMYVPHSQLDASVRR